MKWLRCGGTVWTGVLLAALLFPACQSKQTFPVQGEVMGFGDDGRTVIVAHEEIPGFMAAMTMPFKAEAPADLDSLAVGDRIRFTLVVVDRRTFIRDVAVLPLEAGPLPSEPRSRAAITADTSTQVLLVGETVPVVRLRDQDERPLQLPLGRPFLVTFIYTRCPLPDYCPLMSQHFQALQRRLRERQGDNPLPLVSITLDPLHDTPAVLKTYARRYTDDTTTWTFATGAPDQVTRIATALGVSTRTEGEGITHNLVTAFVSADGRLLYRWTGNDWTPAQVLEKVASP